MKTLNTDTSSHRLFNFKYLKVEVGDGHHESDVSDLLAQLIPVDNGRTRDDQPVMPTLSDEDRDALRGVIRNISTILYECDPMCLNFYTNTDEYDPEAESIVVLFKNKKAVDDVGQMIVDVFMRWFNRDFSEYKFDSKWIHMAQRTSLAWGEYKTDTEGAAE